METDAEAEQPPSRAGEATVGGHQRFQPAPPAQVDAEQEIREWRQNARIYGFAAEPGQVVADEVRQTSVRVHDG